MPQSDTIVRAVREILMNAVADKCTKVEVLASDSGGHMYYYRNEVDLVRHVQSSSECALKITQHLQIMAGIRVDTSGSSLGRIQIELLNEIADFDVERRAGDLSEVVILRRKRGLADSTE